MWTSRRCSSAVRRGGRVLAAGIDGNPVRFPALTAIGGICLLEAPLAGFDRHDQEPNQDHASVHRVLALEAAPAILEVTVHRVGHQTICQVGEMQGPLATRRLVQAQRHARDVAGTVRASVRGFLS